MESCRCLTNTRYCYDNAAVPKNLDTFENSIIPLRIFTNTKHKGKHPTASLNILRSSTIAKEFTQR